MEEATGWRWTNTFHPDDVDACVAKWRAGPSERRTPFEAEGRVRRADGEYRTFQQGKLPLHYERGNILK
jgi:PAS domain-containing protein